jgi:hypothetical protein
MVSLAKVGRRFEVPLVVVEGGRGTLSGVITEADQKQIPVYAFVNPRHVLRTPMVSAARVGMVIRTPAGALYILGENGPSEQREGTLWQSWRLFEVTGRYSWKRRNKVIDPATQLERDDGYEDMGPIYCALEPLDREVGDFRMSASFEQSRIITGRDVRHDDLVDGRKVTRADRTLGVVIGVIT